MTGAWTIVAAAIAALPGLDRDRASRFADPPAVFRMLPMRHNRFEGFETQLPELMRDGFGGYVCNVGPGDLTHPGSKIYLELDDDWMKLRNMVDFSREAGMSVWIYDECGYPSLSAADLVLRGHPELEQTAWFFAFKDVASGDTATLEVPPGRFLGAVAARLDDSGALTGDFEDIAASVRDERELNPPFALARSRPYDADGRSALGLAKSRGEIRTGPLVWKDPGDGFRRRIYVMTEDYLYEGTHPEDKGSLRSVKYRYPNPLSRAAVDRFLAVTHAEYERRVGSDLFARGVTGTFTDEPGMMANWLRPMPYFCLPSDPELAVRYARRTGGRSVVKDIPYLMHDSSDGGATSGRLRLAFWDEAGRQLSENFFGRVTAWCAKRGLVSGGHLMGEEDFAFHVSNYGDFFRALKSFGCPSIDCLYSTPKLVPYLSALFAGSARELAGRDMALVEVSSTEINRKPSYQVSEDELQGTMNRLLWGGIGVFTTYHRWWLYPQEVRRRVSLRTARTATLLLQGGHSAAEIALYYPAKDLMKCYVPQTKVGYERGTPLARLQDAFVGAADALYGDGRGFLIVDEETVERATVEGNALVFGDLRFRALVMPGVKTVSAAAMANLRRFREAGGVLIDTERVGDLLEALESRVERDFRFRCAGKNPIRLAHRRHGNGDVYFVMNDSAESCSGLVEIRGDPGRIELWNPEDGAHVPIPRTADGKPRLSLPPYRAVLLTVDSI